MITLQEVKSESDLASMAKPSCKKCHGTGILGTSKTHQTGLPNNIVICKCVRKAHLEEVRKRLTKPK